MKLGLKKSYKILVRLTVVKSTISPIGVSNSVPFRWNSLMATRHKPLFGFSLNVNHDTWRNIQKNDGFVANLVGEDFGPLMEVLEKDFPNEISEIKKCGLSKVKANWVKPSRIQEAYTRAAMLKNPSGV